MKINYFECPFQDFDVSEGDAIYRCTHPLGDIICFVDNKWNEDNCELLDKINVKISAVENENI